MCLLKRRIVLFLLEGHCLHHKCQQTMAITSRGWGKASLGLQKFKIKHYEEFLVKWIIDMHSFRRNKTLGLMQLNLSEVFTQIPEYFHRRMNTLCFCRYPQYFNFNRNIYSIKHKSHPLACIVKPSPIRYLDP